MIGIEGYGQGDGGQCFPGAVYGGGADRLPIDVDPDAGARVVEGERGGFVRSGGCGRHFEQFRKVGEGGEIDALGRQQRRRDRAVGVGQCDRTDRDTVRGKVTAGICQGDDRRARRGGGTAAAAGEQDGESPREGGQGPRSAAPASANDGHQGIPFDPVWARALSAPSLRGKDGQSVPRNYSDLRVARPGKRASLPVSRRFQLIVSWTAPVPPPRRSIAVGYDWRCKVPVASREFQARTAT